MHTEQTLSANFSAPDPSAPSAVRHIAPAGSFSPDTSLVDVLGAEDGGKFSSVLKINTLADFMGNYPRRWEHRAEPVSSIAATFEGQSICLWLTVETFQRTSSPRNPRVKMLKITAYTDAREEVSANFIGDVAAMQPYVTKGWRFLASGESSFFGSQATLKKAKWEKDPELFKRPVKVVYPGKAKAPAEWVEKKSLEIFCNLEPIPEHLPAWILAERAMPDYDTAMRAFHLPFGLDDAERAKERLTYDEAFATQLAMALARAGANQKVAKSYRHIPGGLLDQFVAKLPYRLTDGQRYAAQRIMGSLAGHKPTRALVVGDVGAGKTVVAVVPLLQVADNGGQGVLLAPTEVLAEQHYQGISRDLEGLGVNLALLTGSMKPSERKDIQRRLLSGEIDILVGTHAVLSDDLQFKDLAVAVIDEQHRFGVDQRNKLAERTPTPHLIQMTATPIPRTIAMTTYGDLEVFELRGVPHGRKPIETHVVHTSRPQWVEGVWRKMGEAVASGRQVFIVGALIDKPEEGKKKRKEMNAYGEEVTTPAKTVKELEREVKARMPHLRTGIMHGKLSAEEKNDVMSAFAAGDLDVLVSTTVIEVGVNVPNASVMCVWDADRFGMAQLHQIRGRVGRGQWEGTCFLVTSTAPDSTSTARLNDIASTTDGFRIAELDLQNRKEGDLLSTSQAGKSSMKLLDLSSAQRVLEIARVDAERLVASDPILRQNPQVKTWLRSMISEDEAAVLLKS